MSLEKTVYLNQLLSYYGNLLTDHQQALMKSYYEEDLSLAEIAEFYDISRQAVHDNLKRSENLLVDYEERLHSLAKSNVRIKGLLAIRQAIEDEADPDQILKQIDQLIQIETE